MEQTRLELHRNDLLQSGACRRQTLVLFPSSNRKQQKIAIGDLNGVVQCFSVKHQDCKTAFKTLPSRQRITALTLGRGLSQRERLFFAEGGVVRGFTKKGKEFFRFDTNLTENIHGLLVVDSTLAVIGEYTYTTFKENREQGFYLSPDRINGFAPLFVDAGLRMTLACQDRSLKVVAGSEVCSRIAVQGVATVVAGPAEVHSMQPGVTHKEMSILYGTENGILGQCFYGSGELRQGFILENPENRGAITAIHAEGRFTKNEMPDIALGRDDGAVEIYALDADGSLERVFDCRLSDRINTLDSGFITSSSSRDIVVQTYTGKVIALSSLDSGMFNHHHHHAHSFKSLSSRGQETDRLGIVEDKIEDAKAQMALLAEQIKEKRELLGQLSDVLTLPSVDIKQSVRLDSRRGCFVVTIEAEKPIASVAICCDVAIELCPSHNGGAILSLSNPGPDAEFPVQATFRCQEASSRLEIEFRAKEGNPGCITSFILPKTSKRSAFSLRHRILPLCCYQRVQDASVEPASSLQLDGDVSDEDVCMWFAAVLPDFPTRWSMDDVLFFRNDLVDNVIRLERKLEAVTIYSPDVVALSILREAITREAADRNRNLRVTIKPDEMSGIKKLQELWDVVETTRRQKEQSQIIKALKEIQEHEGSLTCLDDDLKKIWIETEERERSVEELTKAWESSVDGMLEFLFHVRRLSTSYHSNLSKAELRALIIDDRTTFPTLLNLLHTTP